MDDKKARRSVPSVPAPDRSRRIADAAAPRALASPRASHGPRETRPAANAVAEIAAIAAARRQLEDARLGLSERLDAALAGLDAAGEQASASAAQSEAAAVFASTLREVLGNRALAPAAARRAALLAASATVWEEAIGPLLDAQAARELLGGVSRQRLEQLVSAGRLIVLEERSGQRRFPAWQFGEDGRPLSGLVDAHRALVTDGRMSPWSAASWCVHEHPELEGHTPQAWARSGGDRERLAAVAAHDSARSAR
jgi:hypothetical protein